MRAIKALVIGMTLLMVAGLFLLGYGLYAKSHDLGKPAGAAMAAAGPAAGIGTATATATATFGRLEIPVAAGGRIEQMATVGERLILRLSEGERQRVVVIDPASGQVTGTIETVPAAK